MTRSELRTRILEALDEDPDDPVFWSEEQINGLLNEGQEVLAEETRALKRTALVVRRPGQLLYSTHAIGPQVLAPYRLYAGHYQRALECVTLSDLDERQRLWWDQLGSGEPYVWFSISWDTYGIWPASSTGGEVIEVSYLVWPTNLLDDDDVPEWPEPDQDGLMLYSIYMGLMKRWDVGRATQVLSQFVQSYGESMQRTGFKLFQSRDHFRSRGDGSEQIGGIP